MADVLGARISQRQKFDKQKWFHKNGQENPACTQKTGRQNQRSWREHTRPSFMRLDSAGENSASSCEDLNGAFSPEILASNHCRPRFQEQEPRSFTETPPGGGLLDKVKSAFGTRNQFLPPRRNGTRHLAHHTSSDNSDARLASLDSVAEKFTNMSMPKVNPQAQHWGNPMPNWQQQHANGSPAHYGAQGQWGRTANDPHDRNHAPIFHPYQGMNQPPLLSSTQNYQRNFYSQQPWQHMMGGNCPPYPPFNWGFNQCAPPPHWQQQQQRSRPPFQCQQWLGPQMMQGHGNQGLAMPRHQRAQSPAKRQKWNNQHGNRQRTSPQSKSRCHVDQSKSSSIQTPVQAPSDIESSVDQSLNLQAHVTEVKSDELSSKEETTLDAKQDVECEVSDSAIYSPENLVKTEEDEEHIAIQNENIECQTSCLTAKKEQDLEDACILAIQNENIDHQKPEVSRVHGMDKTESEVIERHSTIDLILADYEVQSSTPAKVTALSYSSDSEYSDGDSDSAVETNADLWESFTASDDPYNPLCGWRCSDGIQEVRPGVKTSIRDCHVDSGTDEGDWSETDSDDDYDSGDDSPVDDVDTGLPRSLKLSDPQLQELRDNLSSTPKVKSDSASAHHPSVAFILGSTSSSSEDEDGDWDTLDDPSSLQDNPLWDSFNRARDPYSPMEAWKFRDSNLSSPVAPSSPSQTTPMRKDSVDGLRTLLLTPTERSCEELSPRDSDGENFAIATVRVHAARDDFGLGLRKPVDCEVALKRVSSASCLRRFQLTPKDKATKKVRFCPNSSFIVLVEKDSTSCETNPSIGAENDWQACARDRMRFKARIDQLSLVLDPVLTNAHREQVYASRKAVGECR